MHERRSSATFKVCYPKVRPCHNRGRSRTTRQIPTMRAVLGHWWTLDLSRLDSMTKRINISIPERVLVLIDK